MKSTALGSAVSVLLAFSAISYAKNYVQDPKPVQPAQTSKQQTESQPVNPETRVSESASVGSHSSPVIEKAAPAASNDDFEVAPQTYTATAYSLRGRTASGMPVNRGLIAADACERQSPLAPLKSAAAPLYSREVYLNAGPSYFVVDGLFLTPSL